LSQRLLNKLATSIGSANLPLGKTSVISKPLDGLRISPCHQQIDIAVAEISSEMVKADNIVLSLIK
jgi:hypothetical protein